MLMERRVRSSSRLAVLSEQGLTARKLLYLRYELEPGRRALGTICRTSQIAVGKAHRRRSEEYRRQAAAIGRQVARTLRRAQRRSRKAGQSLAWHRQARPDRRRRSNGRSPTTRREAVISASSLRSP